MLSRSSYLSLSLSPYLSLFFLANPPSLSLSLSHPFYLSPYLSISLSLSLSFSLSLYLPLSLSPHENLLRGEALLP